jgi:hypothetical protein
MKDEINVHITILSVYYLAQFAISTSFNNNNFFSLKKDKLFGELIKPFSLRFFSLSQEPGFYP